MPPTTAHLPLLRADLIVTQAEVNGEATYTVRDDITGESFRMYAVEYAIAQRLDGARDVPGIIAAVAQDLQLTVTPTQLLSFLRELDARGLIVGFDEAALPETAPALAHPPNLTQTSTLNLSPEALAAFETQTALPTPLDDAETVASPGDAVAAGAFALVTQELVLHERGSQALAKAGLTQELAVDPHEVQKLLRDALYRMVDDDVGGAASILHAAQALAPKDERVSALAEATQTAYARGTQEAAQALRERGASLFPDLMTDALARSTTKPDPAPPKAAQGQGAFGAPEAKAQTAVARSGVRKMAWALAATVLLGALAWGGVGRLGLFGAVAVTTQSAQLVPHEHRVAPAQSVEGEPLASLGFATGGVIAQLPAPGARVAPQEFLASLKLPAPIRQHLLVQGQRLKGAELNIMRLQRQREQLVTERRALMARGNADSRPSAVARRRRLLRRIEREERQVRGTLVTAQSRRAQAEQDYKAQAEAARPMQIFAPKAGVVTALTARVGDTVAPRASVLQLVDGQRLTVAFALVGPVDVPPPGALMTVYLGKNGRRSLQGKVLGAEQEDAGAAAAQGRPTPTTLRLSLTGPDLPLGPEGYAVLAASSPKALQVPMEAVVAATSHAPAHLWQLQDGRLRRLTVTVLEGAGETLWVAPKEPVQGSVLTFVAAATVGGKKADPRGLTEGAAAHLL